MTPCIACEKARVNYSSFTGCLSNFFDIFFGPRLEYIFERSLKLSLHIPKRFNAFQVLKWFSLLLEVTCVTFARMTNTDVWQAIVARSRKKNVVSHLKSFILDLFAWKTRIPRLRRFNSDSALIISKVITGSIQMKDHPMMQ